jgi:hypothetical protein
MVVVPSEKYRSGHMISLLLLSFHRLPIRYYPGSTFGLPALETYTVIAILLGLPLTLALRLVRFPGSFRTVTRSLDTKPF